MKWQEIKVARFLSCTDRKSKEIKTLLDYIQAVRNEPLADSKPKARAWSLCNDTGDSTGKPNGLLQLDFDHVDNVDALKDALVEYGGFLFISLSFSGKGVLALAYIGENAGSIDIIKREVVAPIKAFLDGRGLKSAYSLDESCLKPCQLRFQSYDPNAFVADSFSQLQVNYGDHNAFSSHPMSMLAECFKPGDSESPAAIAAAISAAGCAMDSSSAMYEGAKSYPARAFVVLIGEPGTRKTSLLDAVQDTAASIGVTITDPKNAPTLRDNIKVCGTDRITVITNENGKPKQEVQLVEKKGPADPLLVVIDEAGQILKSRVLDESCGSMGAMLRKCNGNAVTIEAIKGQEKLSGSYRVPANVTALLATTPKQWIEYISSSSQDNGEARRVIELWQPDNQYDMFSTACDNPDIDTAGDALRNLKELSVLWREDGRVFIPKQNTRGAFRAAREHLINAGIDAPSADSLIMCYSTIFAAFRAAQDGDTSITLPDLSAAMWVLGLVLSARAKLKDAVESSKKGAYKPESEVWAEIQAWVDKSPRRDKLREKLARRPPVYMRVFDQMVSSGAVVFDKAENGKYIARFASGDELEKALSKAESVKEAVKAEVTREARPYAECSNDEKYERLLSYYTKFRLDNAVSPGQRNIVLNKLACQLQAHGLWDNVGQDFYWVISENSGLGSNEIKKLMRERNFKKTE